MNYITSITSLHWMLSNVLMAAKVPFLQKIIPYDKRVKTHIIFSSFVILLIIYHGLFKFLIGYEIGITSIPLGLFFLLFVIMSLLWIPLPGFRKIRISIVNIPILKILSNYEFNKKIHIFSQPILGLLIAIHIYYSGILDDIPFISSLIYISLFTLSYSLFILSKTSMFQKKGVIKSIKVIEGIVELNITLDKNIKYKSGQFTFLGFKDSNGVVEEHPFSFLSTGDDVSFGIKVLGDFTKTISQLKVGDKLWIRGCYGNFRPKNNSDKPIVLIGSGIGIVPLLSITKEMILTKSKRKLDLFIAVNSIEEIIDYELLEKAKLTMENLTVHYLIYNEDGKLFSKEYFENVLKEPKLSNYYICSSPVVRNIIVNGLKELNVKKSQLNYEAFSF